MPIRHYQPSDTHEIAEIYNHYIRSSIITFELDEIDANEMQRRINEVCAVAKQHWYVAEIDGKVIGYAYNHRWRHRKAYDHTTEISIYLHHETHGKGAGTALYNHLINQLKSDGFHAAVAGVSLPNEASVKLHEKLGFEKVAHFKEVGFKFEQWIDVGYWQLTFDGSR